MANKFNLESIRVRNENGKLVEISFESGLDFIFEESYTDSERTNMCFLAGVFLGSGLGGILDDDMI